MAGKPQPFKRKRTVDPEVARARAVHAGRSRTGPDYHLRKLAELAPALTADQQRRLAELALAALAPAADDAA
jgi:hypothetical protein